MKVVLEAQNAVGYTQPRGIGIYAINLIDRLLARKTYDYELTFFDFMRERGNYVRAEQYFGKYNPIIHECNDADYRAMIRDDNYFANKSYENCTGTDGDIYHFMAPVSIPTNLKGRMVLTVHDVTWETSPESLSQYTLDIHRIATRRINEVKPHIIADSKSAKQEIMRYMDISAENIDVVYLSYDEQNIYPDKADVSHIVEGEYFLFVGRTFERKKNVTGIITAFSYFAEKYPDVKLVLVGEPPRPKDTELNQLVSSVPFKDRIIFTGYVSSEEKRRLYSNARCFLFPSFAEGFGIPVLEAMACGCPVITADNTSLPEVGGDAALYVDAYNTEQLAYEMERVLTSDTLRNEMIRKGFVQKDKFSWDKTAEQVEEVYARVLLK